MNRAAPSSLTATRLRAKAVLHIPTMVAGTIEAHA